MAASFREIRILHAGDIELDSPFPASDRAESERHRAQVRQMIKDLLAYIRNRSVEIVLLSGNLFDSAYATDDTAATLLDGMAGCAGTRFFVAPGPHDAYADGTLYQVYPTPDNVHIFRRANPERVDLPEWGVSVCGWAYIHATDTASRPVARPFERGECPVLVACGYTSPDGAALTEDQLAACGAVYVGLSCGRDFDGFHHAGTTAWAFSGPPEARDFSHTQFGGVNLLTLRLPDGPAVPASDAATSDAAASDGEQNGENTPEPPSATDGDATDDTAGTAGFGAAGGAALLSRDGCELYGERMLIGCRRYVTVDLPLDGMKKEEEVEQAIRDVIRAGEYGKETSLLIRCTGHTSPDFRPRAQGDPSAYGVAELFFEDASLPDRDDDGYVLDMSVRGEMVRAFAHALEKEKDDPDKKEIAAEALRIAFAALDNKDISHL